MKSASYLSNLTPLRGIAALLTVIFHVDLFMGGALVPPQFSLGLSRMYLMVDFFFILSGFILCYVYGKYFAESVSSTEFRKFSIARFARVYPLHLVTLVYILLLFVVSAKLGIPSNLIMQVDNNAFSFMTNILLLHSMNLHNWFSWVHASWSISTEWWAYMIFPFLVKPFSRLSSMSRGLVALLCFFGYLGIAWYITPYVQYPKAFGWPTDGPIIRTSINVAYQFGYLRCLCGFILGMMLYYGYKENWGRKLLANGYVMLLLGAGVFLTMHFFVSDLLIVSFFPFILLSGAYGSKSMDRFFSTKPLQKLGDWSFSIYLVHQPLIMTVLNAYLYFNPADPKDPNANQPIPTSIGWLICMAFLVLVLFISYLSYRFLEVPARRWINAKAGKEVVPLPAS
jgi:peptidoglycan/LPS O-acetylase OafA/YrhL